MLYLEIKERIESQILRGDYHSGEKLPCE
ncbi:GntR family transcriptional regulator [Oscillospiraceae bacterium BX1]|uniref:GntR family transcriptional regulator n=1 Tax=Yanshouia hominis TaxID=2763673 RepID=A0ABR7NN18_9FIRM|nr:GntR family transcriptional regulator [Yanshouia hominis]